VDRRRADEGAKECWKVDAVKAEGNVDESILSVIVLVACSWTGAELVWVHVVPTRSCLNFSKPLTSDDDREAAGAFYTRCCFQRIEAALDLSVMILDMFRRPTHPNDDSFTERISKSVRIYPDSKFVRVHSNKLS